MESGLAAGCKLQKAGCIRCPLQLFHRRCPGYVPRGDTYVCVVYTCIAIAVHAFKWLSMGSRPLWKESAARTVIRRYACTVIVPRCFLASLRATFSQFTVGCDLCTEALRSFPRIPFQGGFCATFPSPCIFLTNRDARADFYGFVLFVPFGGAT